MRLLNEGGKRSRMPVIAPGLTLCAVHALLHNRPIALIRDEEAVQIEIEAVLDGCAVDLRHKPAGARKRRRVEPNPIPKPHQLFRGAP